MVLWGTRSCARLVQRLAYMCVRTQTFQAGHNHQTRHRVHCALGSLFLAQIKFIAFIEDLANGV